MSASLPELPKPIRSSKHWDDGIDRPFAAERAARLEREDQLRSAHERIAALDAQVAALSKPVSDEECFTNGNDGGGRFLFNDDDINRIIAARLAATDQKPSPG